MSIRTVPCDWPGSTLAYQIGACTIIISNHAAERCRERGYDPRAVAIYVAHHFPRAAKQRQEIHIRKLPGNIPGTRKRHKRGCAVVKLVGAKVVVVTVLEPRRAPTD